MDIYSLPWMVLQPLYFFYLNVQEVLLLYQLCGENLLPLRHHGKIYEHVFLLPFQVLPFFSENVLLEQPFVKDEKQTVEQVIQGMIVKMKENINLRRFMILNVGV